MEMDYHKGWSTQSMSEEEYNREEDTQTIDIEEESKGNWLT